jgi:hypothetical protein
MPLILSGGGTISASSGNTGISIDSLGRVRQPGTQPAFYARRTLGNLVGAQIIIFNATLLNSGSHYNTSTGRFTAPIAGVYEFHVSLLTNGGSNRCQAEIRINGSGNTTMEMGPGYGYQQGGMFLLRSLNANDYAEVALNSATDGMYGSGYNSFSGRLVY